MFKRSRPRSIELVWSGKATQADPAPGVGGCRPTLLEQFTGERPRDPPNQLVLGDNLDLLHAMVAEHAGEVDLIYLDPPFATRGDFDISTELGGRVVRGCAYRDGWGRDLPGYLQMLISRLRLVRELLSPRGSLYVHVDYRTSALVRCLLDEVFGTRSFVNEIVWYYKTGGAPSRLGFARKHDTIFFYVKDPRRALWTPLTEKSYLRHRYGYGNVVIHEDEHGPFTWVGCRDVFDIPALRGNQSERVDFPTQKPEALLERMVRASSVPGSLVMDLFCGSGTTLIVAEKLGRRWLGCDLGRVAIHAARKRLLGLTPRPSFELVGWVPLGGPSTRVGRSLRPLRARVEQVGPRSLAVSLLGLGRDDGKRRASPSPPNAIDYWAVDYDYDGMVFRPAWWAFRTRSQPSLALDAPIYRASSPGPRQVLVKACDPFGVESECLAEVKLG